MEVTYVELVRREVTVDIPEEEVDIVSEQCAELMSDGRDQLFSHVAIAGWDHEEVMDTTTYFKQDDEDV